MEPVLAATDQFVITLYFVVILFIGWRTSRHSRSRDEYLLANRSMPWWGVLFSIYATSLSALTFIGVPGAAFGGDFRYLQLGIGDFFGRVLIAWLLLRAYYEHRVSTVYELLQHRFGPRTQDAGAGIFLIARILASGVRLAGCAIAVHVFFDIGLNPAIILITIVAVTYTVLGGIRAVIWTDTLQFFLFTGAALVTVLLIVSTLPAGWEQFLSVGSSHSKFKIIHFSLDPSHSDYWLDLSNPSSFLAGFLFGCFATFAVLGTDQDMVQRMLTCRSLSDSRKALVLTGLLNFPMTLLFLSVGAALFVYYQVFPDATVADLISRNRFDHIFPYFIRTVIPAGLKGLVLAGLFAAAMSSLDSALNALASSALVDFADRYRKKKLSAEKAVFVSRCLVVLFGIILAVAASIFSSTESILWLGFRIFGYTFGPLLGIFLLAVLTNRKGRDLWNLVIMFSTVPVVILLTGNDLPSAMLTLRKFLLTPFGIEKIAWSWSIILGTCWTFFWTYLISLPPHNQSTATPDP